MLSAGVGPDELLLLVCNSDRTVIIKSTICISPSVLCEEFIVKGGRRSSSSPINAFSDFTYKLETNIAHTSQIFHSSSGSSARSIL